MDLIAEERPGESPLIERVWTSRSEYGTDFTSIASLHSELVVTCYQGKITVTMRGPETMPSTAYCPPDAEFLGIQFKSGVFMPSFPATRLMDRQDVNLPQAGSDSFWFNGGIWEVPDFENAESLVKRLVREELLVYDPLVDSVLGGKVPDTSVRTVQRRFLQSTGLTPTMLFQIQRARHAALLLKRGVSILDTVDQAGFFDQPHLTKAIKRFTGLTPAQLSAPDREEVMSLLYKKEPF